MLDVDGTPTPALYAFEHDDAPGPAIVYVEAEDVPMTSTVRAYICAALGLPNDTLGPLL